MLTPGVAVVLDTETTDFNGRIVEVAVIDASTGEPLLVTLVDPQQPIADAAAAVHGITDAAVAGSPTWDEVLPQLLQVVGDRQVIAYSAEFDRERIMATSEGVGADPGALAAQDRWECLMRARSAWLGTDRWLSLGGPHRGLGDVLAARDLLVTMSQRPRRTIRSRTPVRAGR